MKLKRNFFCITDNYNKLNFRCLFEDKKDAENEILKMKRSTKGETLLISSRKRDFFIDGVKREIIHPAKRTFVRKGCWTTLKAKRLLMLSDVKPHVLFDKTKYSHKSASSFSKQKDHAFSELSPSSFQKRQTSSFFEFDWQNTFLRTKSFATTLGIAVFATLGIVFFLNHNATNKINTLLVDAQTLQARKIVAAQALALQNKDTALSEQFSDELDKLVLKTLSNFENLKVEELEGEIRKMVAGSPMEKMAPIIAKQDRKVAAFLVGIAKKESNFGRRVPVLNGEDCFNYWGYRGIRSRMGTGGHTCFDSPEDAIETVGGRLGRLVNADVDTPQEMVLWKCGSACHKDPMAGKWINDVNMYFKDINENTI